MIDILDMVSPLFFSVKHPFFVIAEFKGNELCRGRRYFFVDILAGTSVGCENIDIIFGNTEMGCKFTLCKLLFAYYFVQSVGKCRYILPPLS